MNIPMDNSSFIDAMVRMKENMTPENRLWFLNRLVEAKFILPVDIYPVPIEGKIASDATIRYFSMKTSKDLIYLVVFTSVEELEKWNKNSNKMYIVRNYNDVKALTLKIEDYAGFVIDPLGCNMAVQKSLIQSIDNARNPNVMITPERVQTKDNMGLMPVLNPPSKVVNSLCEYFKTQDYINCAYYMQTIRKGEEKPTAVLVVDFSKDGNLKKIFDKIAAAAHKVMEEGETIGLMPSFDKVAKKYIEGVEPFYRK